MREIRRPSDEPSACFDTARLGTSRAERRAHGPKTERAPTGAVTLRVVAGLWVFGALLGGCGGVEPAIDERATQSGPLGPTSPSGACYSPTQSVETAYEPGSRGCACDPSRDEDVCVSYDDGGRAHEVALSCIDGVWKAALDGPCALVRSTTDGGLP